MVAGYTVLGVGQIATAYIDAWARCEELVRNRAFIGRVPACGLAALPMKAMATELVGSSCNPDIHVMQYYSANGI